MAEINDLLRDRWSVRELARDFGVSRSALQRHRSHVDRIDSPRQDFEPARNDGLTVGDTIVPRLDVRGRGPAPDGLPAPWALYNRGQRVRVVPDGELAIPLSEAQRFVSEGWADVESQHSATLRNTSAVRMVSTEPGSPDGINCQTYREGTRYQVGSPEMPPHLAEIFVGAGLAVYEDQ